jgi:PKD repeat protein
LSARTKAIIGTSRKRGLRDIWIFLAICSFCSSCQLHVATSLAASFKYAPESPAVGQSVQFTDTSTGAPTSWHWAFGDGLESNAQNPEHTFATATSFEITLAVSDGSQSDSASRVISVSASSTLSASFSYSPLTPVAKQPVLFSDTSTGSPTSWFWSFGDGSSSPAQNPSHSYNATGTYSVALTVRRGQESSDSSRTVTVEESDVITAASASLSDVVVAVSLADYGDIVRVPAGSVIWPGSLSVTKGISLIGAGIGNTIVAGSSSGLIKFTPDSTTRANQNMLRISGFTFKGSPSSVLYLFEDEGETVPLRNLRVDHNRFENVSGYPLEVDGNFWGCVDSNEFAGFLGFSIMGNNQSAWDTFYPGTFSFGTADNLYFEDNVFTGSAELYFNTGHGGRYAFRHNSSTATSIGTPLFDQHGNQSGGLCALMVCEIYENTFTGLSSGINQFDYQRGGKLLLYNNVLNGPYSGLPSIHTDDDVADVDPINQPQHPQDSYFWNNLCNGIRKDATQGATIDYGGSIGIVPRENVHFWNQKDGFDGTVGIGVGLLSARPATCTVGVAYWATDTQTLYKATAPNSWAPYYTPFIYPHPLRK